MITVWGEGRGSWVVWLLGGDGARVQAEAGGHAGNGVENDPEFLGYQPRWVHPGDPGRRCHRGRVGSRILEYLMARYGPIAACAQPARSCLPRPVSSSFTSAKAGLAAFDLLRRRLPATSQPESERRRTGAPARRSGCSTAGWVGDAAPGARRPTWPAVETLYGGRHLGDLCAAASSHKSRGVTLGEAEQLCGPAPAPATALPAGHGDLARAPRSGRQNGRRSMTALLAERGPEYAFSCSAATRVLRVLGSRETSSSHIATAQPMLGRNEGRAIMAAQGLRNLGRSGLRVSPLCLGAMNFGNERFGCDASRPSIGVIHAYFDAGHNFIDTANVYSGTRSETIVSKAVKDRRDAVVIATKAASCSDPARSILARAESMW